MLTLGIDYGDRRFGVAISDPSGSIAFPLEVIEGEEALLARLQEIIPDRNVRRIVVGLPLNMDGSFGPKAKQVTEFCDRLQKRTGIPVSSWDERLTTVEAERLLRSAGATLRQRRARVDKVAAQIVLQSFLDAPASGGDGPENESGR